MKDVGGQSEEPSVRNHLEIDQGHHNQGCVLQQRPEAARSCLSFRVVAGSKVSVT